MGAAPVLPIGYDAETGLYFPLGYTDAEGRIVIETLPDPTPSEKAVTYRSFSGSIKIYFQKVIGQKLGLPYAYPRLAMASLDEAGDPVYVTDVPGVSAAVATAKTILLFIHGIIGDTEGMVRCTQTPLDATGRTLKDNWDLVLTFDYENLSTPIQDTAAALEAKLALIGLKPGHNKLLVIAAHSMGGMVSRWFIEKGAGRDIVQRLVMLGTPNNGTPWADVRDLVAVLLTFAMNGAALLKPWMLLLSGIGRLVQGVQVTLQQMNPTTGLYDQLNSGKDPGIPYTIVAGNTREIIVDYDKMRTLLAKFFEKLRKRGAYDALDTLLFHEANDIAVADTSIGLLKGSDDWGGRKQAPGLPGSQ